MSSSHFTLYTHGSGPNPWRVVIVLKALGLSYESKYLDLHAGESKGPEYTALNPNGRVPTLVDHKNGDFTIWESDAILLYLVETYDTEKKISVSDSKEKFILNQYLFFQASGQGPYFGQAAFFSFLAPEKIPYAVTRYQAEIDRVLGVLESILSKQSYLVGEKVTIADLSFIPWNKLALEALRNPEEEAAETKFPAVTKWHKELLELPYVKATFEEKAALAKK